jgi:hypothetical protein
VPSAFVVPGSIFSAAISSTSVEDSRLEKASPKRRQAT